MEGKMDVNYDFPVTLHLYGDSFEEMTAAMEHVLAEEPLCQKCRVAQIAWGQIDQVSRSQEPERKPGANIF